MAMRKARAETAATLALEVLGDDPAALALVADLIRALTDRSRNHPRVV